MVSAVPSLFSVGGSQSSVATPVVVLTGVVDATVEPEAGVVVVGDVLVVDPEFEAVLDDDVVVEAVAVCVPAAAVAALAGVVTSDERSIVPEVGETRLATESDPVAADVAAEPLDPSSPPQAARVSVARVHSTTLRTFERAPKAKFVICHYPGKTLKSPPGQRYVSRACDIEAADRDPNYDKHCCLPVTPLSRACYSSRPEALRPRLTTGLPLR